MMLTPLNHLDAAFLNIERPQDPWSIHVELQLEGSVEVSRLQDAVHHAIQLHPVARARLQPFRAGSLAYNWQIAEQADMLPLRVVDANTEAELTALRADLMSLSAPLTVCPGFLLVLAHHPDGDRLMINLNHAIADGLSAFRILTSIVRHYAGEADPVPQVDPLAVRDLKALTESHSHKERLERLKLFAEYLVKSAAPPIRIKGRGVQVREPDEMPGYGVHLMPFSAGETAQFMQRRSKPATVNDMVLAGLILTIRAWNQQNGGKTGKVSVMMPVNLRPQEWWFEVVSNFSSYVNVILPDQQQEDFAEATRVICEQTTRYKEAGAAGTLIDLLDIPKFLPAVLKSRLREIVPTLGSNHVQTSWLSNLGRLAVSPVMGGAGRVQAIHFSPPAHMPMGVSVGVASLEDRMMLTLRYRRAVFDEAAARDFADLYRATLLG